jgi:hypothetical protein
MLLWVTGAGIPALFLVSGIPLVLAWVPPNRWYGFRTARTLNNPAVWYPVNRTAGFGLMAAGAMAALTNLILLLCFGDGPTEPVSSWISLQGAGWGILAMIPPWWHVRRL